MGKRAELCFALIPTHPRDAHFLRALRRIARAHASGRHARLCARLKNEKALNLYRMLGFRWIGQLDTPGSRMPTTHDPLKMLEPSDLGICGRAVPRGSSFGAWIRVAERGGSRSSYPVAGRSAAA